MVSDILHYYRIQQLHKEKSKETLIHRIRNEGEGTTGIAKSKESKHLYANKLEVYKTWEVILNYATFPY